MEPKVSIEVAEAQFELFMEKWRLSAKLERMSDEQRDNYTRNRAVFIDAVMDGCLAVEDDGSPVFTPTDSEPRTQLRFKRPRGKTLMAIDDVKQEKQMRRTHAVLSAFTEQNGSVFANMYTSDLDVCYAIMNIALGG
jgi:hypothetical protein